MNPQDPAVPILEEVVAKFCDRARLIFCLEVRGLNYQVSNLTHLLEQHSTTGLSLPIAICASVRTTCEW
jgi:hypothetical protein